MNGQASRRSRRTAAIVTALFAVVVLIPSLYGFGGKFLEFIALYRGDVDGVFAITPIVNYLLASLGFFCLFGWALAQGMFSDIERPKRSMLDTEEQLDALLGGSHSATNRFDADADREGNRIPTRRASEGVRCDHQNSPSLARRASIVGDANSRTSSFDARFGEVDDARR